jgi:glycine oxidase
MPDQRDRGGGTIAVVGAGITGAFTAYFLAQRAADVYLIERGIVGGQASGHNAGGLNPLHGPGIPSPLLELALRSLRLHLDAWDDIRRRSGRAFGGRAVERVHLIMDESDTRADQSAALHDTTPGFASRWLSAAETRGLLPGLSPLAQGGLWTEGSWRVDPERYTACVVDAALNTGVTLVRGEATGVRCRHDRVTAVLVDGEELACDGVVVAPGPWCGVVKEWFGLDLAVSPLKGELLLVGPAPNRPNVEVTWRNVGIHPTGGGRAWLGGTEEACGFNPEPTAAARDTILSGVAGLLPGYRALDVVRHVTGLRPLSADGRPCIGLVEQLRNACVVGGAGRKGMLYGAALGLAAAELVTTGSTGVPVQDCGLQRAGLVA